MTLPNFQEFLSTTWLLYSLNLSTIFIVLNQFPVDTGRKSNVHKTFRRSPGRLLNVLCTFNLRPVSTVKISFLLRKIFYRNLNEAISTNEIASLRFPRKIFLKRKLTIRHENNIPGPCHMLDGLPTLLTVYLQV